MLVKSGDAIDVKTGVLKKVRGFSLTDFDTEGDPVDFELRIIEKEDAIGKVVSFSTDKVKVSQVTDEKYTADPIEREAEREVGPGIPDEEDKE